MKKLKRALGSSETYGGRHGGFVHYYTVSVLLRAPPPFVKVGVKVVYSYSDKIKRIFFLVMQRRKLHFGNSNQVIFVFSSV